MRQALARVRSLALSNSLLHRVLKQLARQVDLKDASPEDHSLRVSQMARKLAEAHGITGPQLLEITVAGLVHDIGKLCIPQAIIEKARPSREEMEIIRRYPEFGVQLLKPLLSMDSVLPMIGSHQERWNGSGYPRGLSSKEIPIGAQIVAICDVYNVLRMDRRYRPAHSEERARQIIQQNIGALWNPAAGLLFLKRVVPDPRIRSKRIA